ncbi:endoplasmic reticulum lectin 1-like isoform X2 [Ptychodera flava]|uniref:endoplasmic reticulum lectin 1-like isoform X2 n=1 Tax=Ptychodera flava TaxID=63121 RepID=UPI003969FAE8
MANTAASAFAVCLLTLLTRLSNSSDFGAFNPDETLFQMQWPGRSLSSMHPGVIAEEVIMKTLDNEEYRCYLPLSNGADDDERKRLEYNGPSGEELIQPLFKQLNCIYRLEAYWNYELCHGKYLRQYHEEKEAGKNVKLQEYYLGRYTSKKTVGNDDVEEPDDDEIPTKKIDGREVSYYEVVMDEGTPCDLNNDSPRKTRILYVCEPGSRGEIYILEEVSTCEYEVVVLTPNLCSNPAYKPKEAPVSEIHCQAISGSPSKPKRLQQLESEGSVGQYSPNNLRPPSQSSRHKHQIQQPKEQPAAEFADKQLIKDFLAGEYCLTGGQGWWKYEFCYGKYALQYHVERNIRTEIRLGQWDEKEHRDWFRKNKRSKGVNVYLYYGHGDVCDLTGKERHVQVKLKCKESQSPHSVSIYLVEPATCEYILGVESPLICSLLSTADDEGVLHPIFD